MWNSFMLIRINATQRAVLLWLIQLIWFVSYSRLALRVVSEPCVKLRNMFLLACDLSAIITRRCFCWVTEVDRHGSTGMKQRNTLPKQSRLSLPYGSFRPPKMLLKHKKCELNGQGFWPAVDSQTSHAQKQPTKSLHWKHFLDPASFNGELVEL